MKRKFLGYSCEEDMCQAYRVELDDWRRFKKRYPRLGARKLIERIKNDHAGSRFLPIPLEPYVQGWRGTKWYPIQQPD